VIGGLGVALASFFVVVGWISTRIEGGRSVRM
jgi:hypothetical protein